MRLELIGRQSCQTRTNPVDTLSCFIQYACQVKVAAFATLVSLLELIPADARRTRVMPVLRDHMQPFDLQPPMQICVARHFGALLNLVGGLWGGWQGVVGKGGVGQGSASPHFCWEGTCPAATCQRGICSCKQLPCSTSRYQPGGWAVRRSPGEGRQGL